MTLTTSPGAPASSTAGDARSHPWLGPLLRRLHFFAGILVGPFILIAAISGALYALTPQLEQIVYDRQLHAPVSASSLTLAEQIRAADDHLGEDASLFAVRPAPEPGDTTRIMYTESGLGPSESRAVFVDPATGEIHGDLVVYGTSGATPLRTWISTLHRTLHLGDIGRVYSELAASWLGIVAVAGLVLWILRLRRNRTKKDLLRPNPRHRGYRALFGWHASLGIWVVLGAVFLSVTGITWSQYAGANVSSIRASLDWGTPSVDTSLTGDGDTVDEHADHGVSREAPSGSANPATFDAVLAIAQRENVNTGQVEIRPPAEPGTAWTVREIKTSFPTEGDSLAIDGTTMQVVDRVDFADFSLPAKLASWGVNLHMGVAFGLLNQVILFVLAVALASMVVLGYLMWWRRRPPRPARMPVGAAPRPGALRDAPWWGVLAVVVVGAVVGVVLPLVGWTLVGFVLIDAVRSRINRSRA